MKISVITVCFNSSATIADTLRSVAGQDHPDIEHIVVDGGSTDGTLEIIAGTPNRISRLVSEADEGIYDAMNKGLALATGDVIGFLNSDDRYASPLVLSRIAKEMADSALDAVMGDVIFFHQNNPHRVIRRFHSERFRPDRLAYGWMPAHPALFMRREAIERVGKFRTDYRIAGDFEFVIRAFVGNSLRYRHVPEVFVNMQTGGVSAAGLRAKILLNREVLRACHENGLRTNILKILSKYPAKLLEMINR